MLTRGAAAALLTLVVLAFASPSARAGDTPYYQGKVRVGLNGGGYSNGEEIDFFATGAVGVFVVDNLELGLDAGVQFGADPIAQLGPQLRYIVPASALVHPYLGVFYRHWFGPDDLLYTDSAGGRAGVLLRTRHVYVGVGLAFEAALSDCEGDGCSDLYPEFGVSLVF